MAPSLYTLLAAGSLLSTALAAPAATPQKPSCGSPPAEPIDPANVPSKWHRYPADRVQSLAPLMPTLDGLAPNTNVTLFVPVLGIGTQNYTCNGTQFVQTETASGALADLYDLTALLLEGDVDVNTIAQEYKAGRLALGALGPQIGLHYFSEDNVPVFNLTGAPEEAVLAGAKIGAVDAPDAEGDVPWLFLLDAGNGVSKKLNTVYRVDTDKGVKRHEECSKEGLTREKKYAAQYWFYE